MSFINVPDQDIGRCRNTRQNVHPDGSVETLRCLDYEGTAHVCTFPASTYVPRPISAQGISSYVPPKPKPWVKPA